MAPRSLSEDALASIDDRLAPTDAMLGHSYPGDDGRRQPVHTVYLPADRFATHTAAHWGAIALSAAEAGGGLERLITDIGIPSAASDTLADLVRTKLTAEPIEDLRLDFEDGYGVRGDETEDADVARAADTVARAVADGTAPPFIGIRFKCMEAPTRRRGLRTLDLFLTGLRDHGELPEGLTLTLPKVTTVSQVEAMAEVCESLESALDLSPGRLRFEVQIETPQVILGRDGTAPVARLLHAAAGRISALHYGTYDYSAALGIAAAHQAMDHPAADHAKSVMQVAVAGTGVHLSDGSTNILPVGAAEHVSAAWHLHARLVRRHLERGIYQGWDLHPAQLPTRYVATYSFYREGFAAASARLRNYVHHNASGILDEPATARALALFIHRGLACGALTADEVEASTHVPIATVRDLALGRSQQTQEENNG
ncbi:Aldolase OS=Tsukamurella paurometabola (strain ATCC 8368 / DSM / CCUG 35730 / CIP 100753 / JCM 10117 / KCTC 9821 / NBRC 16120 / NCIMB 702349 / NCTC 13040)OX=521096 GN=Tpau_2031 PE=4 SV=1 [Tsukamurella paurometabola]|uniref:Aldolase n=1 Tax=Tsukamurella paurometabola (strain ATCC 8368 / DSM 20162 / CCUG 35730 / CIP 100753 / JCM 10117 / KCTC 9821 / NBRC 16120 / NCIMB 702349 / NCTC 13040) TaxID=521096 RepID=D5UNS5_TSUPD|nr:aldolase [Tsukamurella paurometabola]ADG78643.1 conserved hypothetical protein [Tsukamurella paurometabola DSM 20162]SUP32542.1 Citrate lyase beta subunit [Tsukamurella paurometabola]